MTEAYKWLWMQETFGIGTDRAERALRDIGTPDEVLALDSRRVGMDRSLSEREKRAILSPDFSRAKEKLARTQDCGFSPLTPDMPEYPALLREIHSRPLILYTKGDVSLLSEPYPVTCVGTRDPDEYGRRAARKIATEIAGWGGVVISGLARGIDSLCHESALAIGGRTIAVLAGGADSDYPRETLDTRRAIEAHGLLLTEFPVGSQVRGYTFHIRNRILSGLALATVVIQAAEGSGTLITAGHALGQDRDVYAVSGDMFSLKMGGCHSLLADGASPAFSGEQIIRHYESIYEIPLVPVCGAQKIAALANPLEDPQEHSPAPSPRRTRKSPAKRAPAHPDEAALLPRKAAASPAILATLPAMQREVYDVAAGGITFDDLCERTGLSAGELLSALTQLEIFGLIDELPGRRFRQS